MRNGKLGVCVVGSGALGNVHAECWQNLAEAEVVSVVDIDDARAELLAVKCSLDSWVADYRDSITRDDVDVVSVCIPTCMHAEVAVFAAEHGKHVISEKPIALTVAEAESMIEAADENGVQLALGFMRRHSPVLSALRSWLNAGQLGRPLLYQATDYRQIRPKREMHDANANGGPVIDMGVHLYDLWSYIFDAKPVEVYAQGFKFAEGREELSHIEEIAHDTAAIIVRYDSGDVGIFTVSWGLPPKVVPAALPDQLLGPRGMAHVAYGRRHQWAKVLREPPADAAEDVENEWKVLSESREDMYQLEIANFAYSILRDRRPAAGGEEGLMALRVALGALESIETGQPVRL